MTFELTAVPVFRLPEEYRHMGEPSAWAKMTRPGQSMHSFLEAAFFDADGNLWLSDVPYGRVFKVSPRRALVIGPSDRWRTACHAHYARWEAHCS